jgi:hypothetical protein
VRSADGTPRQWSSTPGLGDALVRGRDPQQFVVRPSGAVDRGTTDVSTFPSQPDRRSVKSWLQSARAVALGDGQHPQDVEWAHDGERFWLVQRGL